MNLEDWKEGPPGEYENNLDGKVKLELPDLDKRCIMSRLTQGVVKVTGAPFCSKSRYYKIQRVLEKSST